MIAATLLLIVALVSAQQPKSPQTNPNVPDSSTSVVNGNTEVSLSCGGGEFPADWKKQLTFSERPTTICVRWSGKSPAVWGQWHLYKVINGAPDEKILSFRLRSKVVPN